MFWSHFGTIYEHLMFEVFVEPFLMILFILDKLHTQGPLDGSLYATITKSISPLTSRNVQSIDASPSDSNRLLSTILEWDNNLQQGRSVDVVDNTSFRQTIQPPRRKYYTNNDSRNHARSPLTLSIDSGISSNEHSKI